MNRYSFAYINEDTPINRVGFATVMCVALMSMPTHLTAQGGGECRACGPYVGGTAGKCAAAAAAAGVNAAVAGEVCAAAPPPGKCGPAVQYLQNQARTLQKQYCKDIADYRADYCKKDSAGLEQKARDARNDRDGYEDLRGDRAPIDPECLGLVSLPPFNSDCGFGQMKCEGGGGTQRGGGGGDGPPGNGTGGGGGGGSNPGGNPPPSPPFHQRPVLELFLIPGSQLFFPPPKNYHKLAVPIILQNRAAGQLALARDHFNNPVHAPDYDQPEFPETSPAPAPPGADEATQRALAIADALHREAVYLDAFAIDLNRYLGAKDHKDREAMLRLAAAMVTLIDLALAAGYEVAQKQIELEALIEPTLNYIRAAVQAKGVSWEQTVKQAQDNIRSQPLPEEIQKELSDAKVSPDEVAAFKQQLAQTTPETVDADIAAVKNLTSTEAPYNSDLKRAAKLAFDSWNEAKAVPVAAQSSKPSSNTPPATGKGSPQTVTGSGDSYWRCSLFGALGAFVIVGFAMGVRSARGARIRGSQGPSA